MFSAKSIVINSLKNKLSLRGCDDTIGRDKSNKGLILKEKEKLIASKYLDLWVRCFYELEKKYISGSPIIDSDNYDFIFRIGEGVCFLNSCNSLVISSLERFINVDIFQVEINDEERKDQIGKYKDLVSYMRFFNNLISSKIKYFFFRETPVQSINFPLLDVDKNLVLAGYDLLDLLSDIKVDLNQLKIVVTKYYYLQVLMYSFVFNGNSRNGVFLRFKYDKVKYDSISNSIIKLSQDYLSSDCNKSSLNIEYVRKIKLKFFMSKLSCLVIESYAQSNKCNEDINKEKYGIINKPNCYNEFYDFAVKANSNMSIEPFTYRLLDIMWKINGMLLIGDKNKNCKVSDLCNFPVVKVSEFIAEYIIAVGKMYNEGKIDYEKLYEVESGLFKKGGLYKKIFKEEKASNIRDKFIAIQEINRNKNTYVEIEKEKIPAISIVKNNIIYKRESNLKIDVLIESLAPYELYAIFKAYADMVYYHNKDMFDNCSEVVGFYRAGVFLSHMLNVMFHKDKKIWLFNTRPYVATHPIHNEDACQGLEKILLIDENIKTGYTYQLYKSYIKRNHYRYNINIRMYTIFDFISYKRISGILEKDYKSLIVANENKDLTVDTEYLQSSDYKIIINKIDILDVVNKIMNSDGSFDLSFMMANTDVIMSICDIFIGIIMENITENQKVIIFPASVNGEVIAMMFAFLLKVKYNVEVKFARYGYKKNEDDYVVAIDVSFESGFSVIYNWALMINGHYKYDDKLLLNDNNFDQFLPGIDKIMVLFNGGEIKLNKLISIIDSNAY